ncbi:MAG TPA: protein translocase subunit SecD [Ktedonobacterales bacterium]|nr:protein translocase subunit SecD [Ktedonobacterales bacterium]
MRGNTVRSILFLVFILLLGAGAAYVANPNTAGIHIGGKTGYNNALKANLGLDLTGGVEIQLQAHCPPDQPKCDINALLPNTVNTVQSRVTGGLGVNDALVQTLDNNRILIQLPNQKDPEQAKAVLGKTGLMQIIDTQGTPLAVGTTVEPGQYKVLFTGAQLDPNSINAQLDQTNQPIVTFQFKGDARAAFAAYTRDHVGQYLTTVVDGQVINSASIQSEIDGQGEINGMGTIQAAQELATQLKYGSLPLPLTVTEVRQVAATLGQQAIEFSIRAALVGLGIVVLFMIIYYRLPGLLADVALVLYSLFLVSVIKLLGVTLSLEGIAAVVLTIGMAVDANILIFERMKEELRAGRTMASAVDLGFKRAWPSIRDSNASTLITAAILYWFGNTFGATNIVGFATNLFIGVVLSLFTAVVVTRNFLNLLMFSGIATHPALYSLPADALNVPRYNPRLRQPSKRPAVVTPSRAPAVVEAEESEEDLDAEADDESGDSLAGVGAGSNGAKPNAARMATEQTGAEE